jgi:2-polyprenyl-6-hydroxyphenyl methylase/3-demethylubiquinone-9 3-methyltransferase
MAQSVSYSDTIAQDLQGVRLPVILDMIRRHFGREAVAPGDEAAVLKGLHVLDVGCGGGAMAEPLAERGALVTGIDLVADQIAAAELRAKDRGLAIEYGVESAEALAQSGALYDVVLALDVIEHAADQTALLKALARLVKPGGLLLVTTLNRTLKSFLYAIVAAEHVLRYLPRGTHSWDKFRRPEEIHGVIAAEGLVTERIIGLSFSPFRMPRWRISSDLGTRYLMRATRPRVRTAEAILLPGPDSTP